MKAEKVELREEIDTAVGEIGKSLQDVRMSLPPEGVMLKLRAGLREKANRSDLLKLRSKLNVLSGENDRDAPGLSKRCLSCDRPIVTSQESIDMITQANLALTQNMKMMTSMQSTKSINFGSHNRPESAGGLKSPNGNGNGNGIGNGNGNGGEYRNFPKQKMRPTSAGPGSSPSPGSKSRSFGDKHKRETAKKYGVEKPLHVALFDYDKKKVVRSSLDRAAGAAAGGVSVNVKAGLMESLRAEADFENNKPVLN